MSELGLKMTDELQRVLDKPFLYPEEAAQIESLVQKRMLKKRKEKPFDKRRVNSAEDLATAIRKRPGLDRFQYADMLNISPDDVDILIKKSGDDLGIVGKKVIRQKVAHIIYTIPKWRKK